MLIFKMKEISHSFLLFYLIICLKNLFLQIYNEISTSREVSIENLTSDNSSK